MTELKYLGVKWTQKNIEQWAADKFGRRSALETAIRGNKEMGELLTALHNGKNDLAVGEVADVAIFLLQVAERLGFDLMLEVQNKMNINAGRNWQQLEDGSFQHV